MPPEIQELADRIAELTEDELRELCAAIVKRFDELEQGEESTFAVAEMSRLADLAQKVTARLARLNVDGARQLTASGTERPSCVEAVRRGNANRPVGRNPERREPTKRHGARVLLATGAASYAQGPLTDRYELAEAMTIHLSRMNRHGPPRGVALVASAEWDYPEERQLGESAMENLRKIEAAVGLPALTASGGICLPVNVDYDVPTWATADRPLRDGLPAFGASRGGLRFVTPPDVGTLEAATGIWTEATDAEPLAATKPLYSVACGEEQLVYAAAVSTRLGFGNMQSRFQPEMVAANTDLAIAAAARKAELHLLELINEKCVKDVTSSKVLGATRDLITAILQASANFRYTHRISREVKLTAVFPGWLLDLIKIDLAREIGHAQNGEWNSLALTDDQVREMLEAQGIRPIFLLDGLAEEEGKFPSQNFAAQTANGAIKTFPTKMVWNLFPEGSMQFLDGGRLDLGVVRDSTLDATNDYETFVETFEGIADRGFSKSALQFVTELCANGESGATATVATCA